MIRFAFVLLLLLAVATTVTQAGVLYRGAELENWTDKLPVDIQSGAQIPLWVGLQADWSAILATNQGTQITYLYFLPKGGDVFQKVWDDSAEKTKLMEIDPGNRLVVYPPAINDVGMVMKTRPWPPRNEQSFYFNPSTQEVKLLFSGGYESDGTRVMVDTFSAAGLKETTINYQGVFWPTSPTTFVGPLRFAFGFANGVYEYNSETGEFTLLSRHGEATGQLVYTSDVVGDSEGNLYWNSSDVGGLLKFNGARRVLGIRGVLYENYNKLF